MDKVSKKLRIATYYDPQLSGRNDGGPLYYSHILKKMGHDVIHLSGEEMSSAELQKFGKFDLHFYVDWGEDGLRIPYKLIEKLPSPSVYIPCDTHITEAGKEYRFKRADNSDWVFWNQKRGMEEYNQRTGNVEQRAFWLPCAVEPQAYPNEPIAIKKYDISFVGHVTFEKRAVMLDRIFKEFPNFWYGQRLFENAAEIYRKSKIVFNTAANDDENMRLFEATATGSFLLTEWTSHIDELFEDGKHLVTYKTLDEAVEKAKYYLDPANEQERELIAKTGMEHTLANHTYEIRANTILSTIFGKDDYGTTKKSTT